MSQAVKCTKPACGGTIEFVTDGIGRVIERCPRCRERQREAARRAAAAQRATATQVPAFVVASPTHRRARRAERDTAIITAYRGGATLARIGSRHGLTAARVRQILEECGVQRRPRGRVPRARKVAA